MNTQNNNNIAAPSVTIAPRSPKKGVRVFVVTLTTFQNARSYPCRSLESALKLAERFVASVTGPRPETTLTPEQQAENLANPDRYDGPPRTAEEVAA